MAPENGGPLEKEIPIGKHHFQGLCLSQGEYPSSHYSRKWKMGPSPFFLCFLSFRVTFRKVHDLLARGINFSSWDMVRHDGQKIEMETQDGHNTTLGN